MKTTLTLAGLLVLLAGPADESLHQHPFGTSHDDCLACQSNHTPAELVVVTLTVAPAPLISVQETSTTCEPTLVEDHLLDAPKTSPPRGSFGII